MTLQLYNGKSKCGHDVEFVDKQSSDEKRTQNSVEKKDIMVVMIRIRFFKHVSVQRYNDAWQPSLKLAELVLSL